MNSLFGHALRNMPMKMQYAPSRIGLCLCLLGLTAVRTFSMPADERFRVFRQPDGSTFEAKLTGDENFSFYQLANKQVIVKDAHTGYWMQTRPSADGSLEITTDKVGATLDKYRQLDSSSYQTWLQKKVLRSRQIKQTDNSENKIFIKPTGTIKAVIVLVNFSDTTVTYSKEDFVSFFNTPGYGEHGSSGSVADFFTENSYGKLKISFNVYGWFTLPKTRYAYGHNDPNTGRDQDREGMIKDAIAVCNPQINFAGYDDGDGWVDFFGVVFAGPGEEQTGVPEDAIWPHRGSLAQPVTADGRKLQRYFAASEVYGSNIGPLGTCVHEMGHMFGLPDLYDTNAISNGVGIWSTMGQGGWLGPHGDGGKPAHYDAWCKLALGWIDPVRLSGGPRQASIGAFDRSGEAILIPIDPCQDSEYFLLSHRYPRPGPPGTGFDEYLPGGGILIEHVNEYFPNNNTFFKRKVDIEQADGRFDLDFSANRGDAGDLYQNSSGVFSDFNLPFAYTSEFQPSGVKINDFMGSGTEMMSMTVQAPLPVGYSLNNDPFGPDGYGLGYNDGDDYGAVKYVTGAAGLLARVRTYFVYDGLTQYQIKIYNGWNVNQPLGLLYQQSGAHSGAGYETIALNSPLDVHENQTIYIVIRYNTGGADKYPVPRSYSYIGNGLNWVGDHENDFYQLIAYNGFPYSLNIRADIRIPNGIDPSWVFYP